MLEGLEQLRFLERGRRILCVEVESRGREFWELNNPSDVPKLEAMMSRMGISEGQSPSIWARSAPVQGRRFRRLARRLSARLFR